jgi:hypothetical protein
LKKIINQKNLDIYYQNLDIFTEFFMVKMKFKLEEVISNQENQINILKYENSQKEDLIGSMKMRKLSFKERITGKIITEDEN